MIVMAFTWWLSLAFNRRSHLLDQLSACSIYDPSSCSWLLRAMSFTSSAKNKWLQISSFYRSFINIRNRRGPQRLESRRFLRYLRSRGGVPISLQMSCSLGIPVPILKRYCHISNKRLVTLTYTALTHFNLALLMIKSFWKYASVIHLFLNPLKLK